MPTPSFTEKLTRAIERNNSLLCAGLDPDPHKFPVHFPAGIDAAGLTAWGRAIIEQTADLVCCYKPNFAFYEQFGPAGLEALRQTIAAVPADLPVLLDAKRGDIGSTAAAYARAAFEVWGADAITANPYLGRDAIAPFLTYPGKTVFVLCYTSNPSAREIQEFGAAGTRLFEHVARQAQRWGDENQIAFVVGATQPAALARFRQVAPDRWVLAPGLGAQGGDPAALTAGLDEHGRGLIVPVSRGVIYAESPRAVALTLRDEINQTRLKKEISKPATPYIDLILQLHELGCIQFGNFTLASGQASPIYLDLRRLAARPALLHLAAEAYAGLLQSLTFDHLAGVPYAALPIGTAVALTTGRSLIYPRKETKTYGTGRAVEGLFAEGDRAVIIEDVVTSGNSIRKTIGLLNAAGVQVSDVLALIDREQGGREALAAAGYRLHTVLRLSEVLETLHAAGRISAEQVEVVRVYLRGD